MEVIMRSGVDALVEVVADRVLTAATAAITDRGRFTVALAGGSTPAALYRLLASPCCIDRLDWLRTEVFFGDERCVPPDHEWSNYAMAWRTLLSHAPLPPDQLHRIRGEWAPQAAAETYARTLARTFGTDKTPWPRFDVILLGMGDDGHTASLFPGMGALAEDSAMVVATGVPSYVHPQTSRVTLTLPVLNAARKVMFLVAGESKADMMKRVLKGIQQGEGDDAQVPAARVQPLQGQVTWFLDQAAASKMRQE